MKLKRRRASEVPPKIRSFIDDVIATPLENIEEPLKGFIWEFDKGDFHHWVDLFNHFDTFFEKHIKTRKDLQLEDDFLESDGRFPREPILQILRVIRIILENCSNKHFYSSYEHHLSLLLASTDGDVIEACLQTLAAFLKKTVGKYVLRDSSLSLKLFSLAQGWGGKEEGLGLIRCVMEDESDQCAYALASTLHFEFYAANEASGELLAAEKAKQGLQIIHLPNIDTYQDSDLEILHKLVKEYRVPASLRFPLLTRLRFARACSSVVSRQQYTCIRLYAFIVLVQACGDTGDLVSFFNTEPEFINELVSLLSYEDAVPPKIRILSLLSLIALCQDRSRQPSVLAAVTSGGHRGILSSLMQKAIDSVVGNSSKWVAVFLEALLSLIAVLVSSSSGSSAMREAGFIPTLLPLLKDNDPQHLHLVSMAVHVLEAFMDYSNPAAALFRDLGGLDDTISRLSVEVSCVETGSEQQDVSTEPSTSEYSAAKGITSTSTELDEMHLHYSEAMIGYHRRLLMKALLRAISLGMYAPGSTARIYGSEESLLPQCLGSIFRRAKDFGGGVFALAATVMSDLIHKDPTCYLVLEAAHLPATFLGAINDGVVCSSDAIACIPQCLDALCLNSNGLQSVKDQNALRCFVKIFTSRTYLRALSGDTSATLSSGLDELMRHAPSLRGPGVDMLIEILDSVVKIGSGAEAASCSSCVTPVPMETDAEVTNMIAVDGTDSCKVEKCDKSLESAPDTSLMNTESFLPDCICNVARLLEATLQNADTCRIFVEKKGIEVVLQLFQLPLLPLSVSVGQSISVAFKNFSAHHSASLARAVCSFLREHSKLTNELLVSVGGTQLAQIESSKQMKILKCLCTLDSVLSLSSSLLKGTTTVLSELGSADADVLKDLGKSYREILWQISLCGDVKADDKQNSETEAVSADAAMSNAAGRESDDDANFSMIRYMNPVSVRNSSQSQWGPERDFLSVVRSGEGFSGRTRNGIRRLRGGRTGRHLEALNIEPEVSTNVVDYSTLETKKKSPDVLVAETLNKLISTLRAFFTALLRGFSSPNRRRTESGSLNTASKSIGMGLAKVFLEAFNFPGYSVPAGLDLSLCAKCRYLGKVVDDMAALTFDSRRRICYTAMINYFYVHGTFKELLTTFEATSQLLWSLPCSTSMPEVDCEVTGDVSKLCHDSWLLDTLQSYCRLLEYFVNSSILLSPTPASQVQLLVQPVAVGLSIGLFPVPKEPEVFVRMMQSQVLDVILPVWKHPMFPNCSAGFISKIVALVNHIYSGVGDVKPNRSGISGSSNQRLAPPPDEATIATIVEMGFTRARAEEALRRVESNSVEMAMEWLFSHVEDPVQEDDELARALALSLGSSSEPSRVDGPDKSMDLPTDEGYTKAPPLDDILTSAMKLFQGNDSVAFPLMELLVTLCNRNKGEDRPKVISYLIQQLKLCPLEPTPDTSALSLVSHILALVLSEDGGSREIAAENGIVTVAIELLMNLRTKTESGSDVVAPKCISSLLLILDSLLQSRPRLSLGVSSGSLLEHGVPSSAPKGIKEKKSNSEVNGKESDTAFEKIFGKSTGYLTIEESRRLLVVACDFIKQHVPAVVMQAVLQLCARLTKTHSLSLQFLENGGMAALFSLPRSCIFPGYDTLASTIIRHLLEDPQTLQTAMELEIRQTLSGNRHAVRVAPRSFLTSMAPVISRDPVIFMRAAAAVCQLEASGGRTVVVLSKERDKEKEKSKLTGVECGVSINECVKAPESKATDSTGKCSKGHKKIPANLTQVIDQLLDIVLKYPSPTTDDHKSCLAEMEVDQPASRIKGKTKVGETKTIESDDLSEKSTTLAKVTFVLKLLSDVVLMYAHAVGVILRRDSELSQLRGPNYLGSLEHGGILHHILHRLLPLSTDKSAGPDEWRNKLSEKASWFLVVLCGRSNEGRRRVISELVKALSTSSNSESNSSTSYLLPDKNVRSLVELVYSILSKNSTSSTVPGSGCSPDIAKGMVDGGIVKSLTAILQAIDLDHPDAPKLVNLILKSLESLTRVVNASEQSKFDELYKKKPITVNGTPDVQAVNTSVAEIEPNQNLGSQQGVTLSADDDHQQNQGTVQCQGDQIAANQSPEQDMGAEVEQTVTANPPSETGMDFIHEEIEDGGGVLHDTDQMDIGFHVENRADDDMGDEDDDMGDDGEDDDDDEGEDEDEDIAEDGTALMSLADTDVEDHDDAGLGDDYNDDMVDDDDDDFQENHLIEVRWREALDGLDHLQVLGQPGSTGGLFDVAPEPFEGVNVDDFFGLRRPLGFERRRQTTRSSFERSVTEGNRLQHPLLTRPSQSGDFVSMWSSGGNSSRDSDPSTGNFDIAHFYMFDAPVLPYDHAPASLFGDRLGSAALPSLSDFSVGLDSLRLTDRRGPGDGRWTDDGQPQAGGLAASIAQAIEEQFTCQLRSLAPDNSLIRRPPTNVERHEEQQADTLVTNVTQLPALGDDHTVLQETQRREDGDEPAHCTTSQAVESVPLAEQANPDEANECHQVLEPLSSEALEENSVLNGHDCMEAGERTGTVNEQDAGRDEPSASDGPSSCFAQATSGFNTSHQGDDDNSVNGVPNVDLSNVAGETIQVEQSLPFEVDMDELSSRQNMIGDEDGGQSNQLTSNNEAANANGIDPTFLEALPEDLRAEVLASQQAQSAQAPAHPPPSAEDIDPEFLAALPPDIQAEVLAQQRARRIAQQAEGQPVDMDNASIIATFPAELREEVLLTSSEAVLSALPSPLLAEAQMLRDRAMSHYQARSLLGGTHRLNNRRNGLGFDRQTVIDRGVGVTLSRRGTSALVDSLKLKEIEGEQLLDGHALKALIRLLRLAQPLGKGLLQRLLLNLCAHSVTRSILVWLLLDMIKPVAESSASGSITTNSQRLYGCQSNVVYGRSQLLDGLPPLVLRRILEILTYLATNHSAVANSLFYFDLLHIPDYLNPSFSDHSKDKGKKKVGEGQELSNPSDQIYDIPLILLLKLLSQPLFLRSSVHLEQVMNLIQVVIHTAASKLETESHLEKVTLDSQHTRQEEATAGIKSESLLSKVEPNDDGQTSSVKSLVPDGKKGLSTCSIFLQLPKSDLHNLCTLLGHEGLSDKVYSFAIEVLTKLAVVAAPHKIYFISELSELALTLSSSAVNELITLRDSNMLGLNAGSMAGPAMLRVLQTLKSLTSHAVDGNKGIEGSEVGEELNIMSRLSLELEPLWQTLSECISTTEAELAKSSLSPVISNSIVVEHGPATSSLTPPLPPGTQRLLPFIEGFFVLSEKLQANNSIVQQDNGVITTVEVKDPSGTSAASPRCGINSEKRFDSAVSFAKFSEKHRLLLNAFIRQNPGLLEKSLFMMLKTPRLIDFDNKRAYFRSRIRLQHEQHLSGPLRISVRRAYVLEDSYNQLRMRPSQDLKGRLNVHFQGEEGIDAGGLTREWYQLLSRVIFDKGALLFTTVGNNATFQPNPNSVYQTEHLSYFKFVGRVVAKALFDAQLLDVYFTRSFYKHILGVNVTYHDIEAVDPDYYKNLKWMLENDVSDVPDLTFSMDADEEKHILYEKTQVTDYELKPGGGNIRVTEETKHEYVDLVAKHILTNAIRPQINSFLEGFSELIPRELISIFNDKELELLISGLPEIDFDDLKANTEYTGYTAASSVIQWFWEVVKAFNKEDMARFLQFVTGTSKVPLEGFKALQGISGPQKFQIHKAYGAPERLPSAHTCFNQLDLPEYTSKDQLKERLLLAIHEASEGFGFG